MAPGYARHYSNGNEVSANNWENGASSLTSGTGMATQRRRANGHIQERLPAAAVSFPRRVWGRKTSYLTTSLVPSHTLLN